MKLDWQTFVHSWRTAGGRTIFMAEPGKVDILSARNLRCSPLSQSRSVPPPSVRSPLLTIFPCATGTSASFFGASTLASVDSVISVVKMIPLHHRGHREHRGNAIGDGAILPTLQSRHGRPHSPTSTNAVKACGLDATVATNPRSGLRLPARAAAAASSAVPYAFFIRTGRKPMK